MKRRDLLKLGTMGYLTACSDPNRLEVNATTDEYFNWRMATTWPPNFPGLGAGALNLKRYIEDASQGRIRIELYAANELIPPFEVFDAVSQGSIEMGHSGAYYWRGKAEAVQFFSSVPFGMNAHEVNAWIYYGGGLELWTEVYEPFGVIPFPAGNSGVQMGGWFNKRIDTIEDLIGLRMRLPGIGGEVLRRAGGVPLTLPGAELFTALSTGALDATEWVGPYNDIAFGLHQAARYYYYPGWHEPGPIMECIINQSAYEGLPSDLQAIVRVACQAANLDMISEYNARNARSLSQLRNNEDVEILSFPADVLNELKKLTGEVIEELIARDAQSARVWSSYQGFMSQSKGWLNISEKSYLSL